MSDGAPDSAGSQAQRSERIEELLKELRALLHNESDRTRLLWSRTMPFADYVSDRWQKAQSLGFGKGTSVYDSVLVLGDVRVGNNTWIGPFVVLDGSGALTIGNNCSISAGVQIYTHDTVAWAVSGGKRNAEHAPVRIGNNCYIGPNAIIAKGVTIGDRCVIGANSFVRSDIPGDTKAWGNPARCRGHLPPIE